MESRPEPKYWDRDWLSEQVEDGLTTREIARLVDVSPETIRYWMNQHDIER